jgi:competence protein ComEC
MRDRTLGNRAPLLWIVAPFLAGLAAGEGGLVATGPIAFAAALLAASGALAASLRASRLWAPAILCAMGLSGTASYGLCARHPAGWEGMRKREVRVSLHIERVGPGSETTRRATGTATVAAEGGRRGNLAGARVYFSLWLRRGQPAPVGSSTMDAVGLIAPVPRHPPADSFDGYLHGLGVAFFLSRGRLLSVQKAPTAYRRWCETIAQRMNELLGYGLGRRPALAAVYRAMMLGRRRGLSKEQGLLFLHGGAMHLFAINGLHIGVVALSMNALLALLRFPRRFAAVLVLAVLWLDVDTTGASPSALRAFLMVAAVEIAWMLRRPVNPLAAVTTSALIVVLADPMEFLSASFQMSYSVVAAIFLLGLPLGARLQARFPANRDLPEGSWLWRHRAAAAATRHLYPAVGVGAAAALVSAVAGVEFFGLFAPIGIAANLVLAPLASIVIVAGFGSLVAGMACAAAASRLFNCAAGVLLGLIDVLLRLATEIPGAWFPAHYRATWTGPAALAALVGSCMAGYASGWRIERGGFWPPFAIAAIALGLGARFG